MSHHSPWPLALPAARWLASTALEKLAKAPWERARHRLASGAFLAFGADCETRLQGAHALAFSLEHRCMASRLVAYAWRVRGVTSAQQDEMLRHGVRHGVKPPRPTSGLFVGLTLVGIATGTGCGGEIRTDPSGHPSLTELPSARGTEDDYCCLEEAGSQLPGCTPNDALTGRCPDPSSYGFQCLPGDEPSMYDSSLVCGTPMADGSYVDRALQALCFGLPSDASRSCDGRVRCNGDRLL